jgi:DNA invertase Pin-like site-specific DNA recombinase
MLHLGGNMTVYGYTRVSTIKQANEGESLETQKRQIIGYADAKGWSLSCGNIFIEKGVSGGVEFNCRPVGNKLLEVLQANDVLVIPKLDRAFRSTRDAMNVLHFLKEKEISVHSLDMGEVTGSGVGAIIFTILSAFASFERDRVATRIREVKQRRKSDGFYVGGRRGFGFNVIDGKKVANLDEQKLLKRMKKMREKGQTLKEIHAWLNSIGGQKLAYSSLREALLR